MLRKFLAETVTNGSIGLNRPKGYIPLVQWLFVFCVLYFSEQRALLTTFQPTYLQT